MRSAIGGRLNALSDQVFGGNVSASEAQFCVCLGTWVLLDKVLAPG